MDKQLMNETDKQSVNDFNMALISTMNKLESQVEVIKSELQYIKGILDKHETSRDIIALLDIRVTKVEDKLQANAERGRYVWMVVPVVMTIIVAAGGFFAWALSHVSFK